MRERDERERMPFGNDLDVYRPAEEKCADILRVFFTASAVHL